MQTQLNHKEELIINAIKTQEGWKNLIESIHGLQERINDVIQIFNNNFAPEVAEILSEQLEFKCCSKIKEKEEKKFLKSFFSRNGKDLYDIKNDRRKENYEKELENIKSNFQFYKTRLSEFGAFNLDIKDIFNFLEQEEIFRKCVSEIIDIFDYKVMKYEDFDKIENLLKDLKNISNNVYDLIYLKYFEKDEEEFITKDEDFDLWKDILENKKMQDYSLILNHPEKDFILTRLYAGHSPESVHQWLFTKYRNKQNGNNLIISIKVLQKFCENLDNSHKNDIEKKK